MKPALDGIRILDLTRLIPGPFCTMILADLGAEVIKVEEPHIGDYERQIKPIQNGMAYRFMLLNRNKKSIGLNLKEAEGRKLFLNLVGTSDAVVEGFRPGTMERLGLGYEELKKVNEGVVYCSLSSYGYSGPDRDKVAHDINILAQIGLLDLMGLAQGSPVIPAVQLVDTVAALYAVIAVQAALATKIKSGKGQHIDISMHDCAFSLMFDNARYPLGEGRVPQRGAERLMGGLSNYNVYKTKDNQYVAIGALENKFKNRLLSRLGLDSYIEKGSSHTTSEVNVEKETELSKCFTDIFAQKPLRVWKEILEKENVFFSPIVNIEEALQDRQLKSRNMIVETRHPVAGSLIQIGSPIKLSENQIDIERLPAPRLGENTQEILKELGIPKDEIEKLIEKGILNSPCL